jgi:uncharacterized Zn-finger protein
MIYEANATIATNLGEAYSDRDALARVLGNEERLDYQDEVLRNIEALLPTLSVEKLEKFGAWVAAQTPEATEEAGYGQEVETPDFTCDGCGKDFYHPHEGLFMGRNEEAFCLDCYLKNA